MQVHCDNCLFSSRGEPDIAPPKLACKRFPPDIEGRYPTIDPGNYCGEWVHDSRFTAYYDRRGAGF
jgi:hypothetical protein